MLYLLVWLEPVFRLQVPGPRGPTGSKLRDRILRSLPLPVLALRGLGRGSSRWQASNFQGKLHRATTNIHVINYHKVIRVFVLSKNLWAGTINFCKILLSFLIFWGVNFIDIPWNENNVHFTFNSKFNSDSIWITYYTSCLNKNFYTNSNEDNFKISKR